MIHTFHRQHYLQATEIIDWQDPAVLSQAQQLVRLTDGQEAAIARICFEWVRDQIRHSLDYQLNPITCRASDVLKYQTGYCYAKSHLLAALLRANGIPAGFCYQRLRVNDSGSSYCLHGFNGIYLSDIGWYRVDPRGNRPGVNAQFTPPQEQLAFKPQLPEEADFKAVLADPLPMVIKSLHRYSTWDTLLNHLPDITPQDCKDFPLASYC